MSVDTAILTVEAIFEQCRRKVFVIHAIGGAVGLVEPFQVSPSESTQQNDGSENRVTTFV